MVEYKLYINDEQLDVLTVDVPISFSITDINESGTKKANKTGIIKVPDTERNRKIIGFRYDPNIAKTITGDTALLTEGTFEFIGNIIYYKTTIEKNIIYYELQIVAGNAEWVSGLTGISLKDLTIPTIEHEYSYDNIDGSEVGVEGVTDYLYPLIDYGKFINGYYVTLCDRLPAIRLITVIKAIFKKVGIAVSSTFLNTADFAKWFFTNNNYDIYDSETLKEYQFMAGFFVTDVNQQTIPSQAAPTAISPFLGSTDKIVPFDDDSNAPFFDTSSQYDTTTYTYTVAAGKAGNFRFRCHLLVQLWVQWSDGLDTTFMLEIYQNAVQIARDTYAFGVQPSGIINLARQMECMSEYVACNVTDAITAKITVSGTIENHSGYPTYLHVDLISMEESYLISEALTRPAEGHDWTTAELLPDIECLEFLRGVNGLFNLNYLTDNFIKTVYIEPDETFRAGDPIDWSVKLDTSRTIVVKKIDTPSWKIYRMKIDGADKVIQNMESVIAFSNGNGETELFENKVFADTMLDYSREIGLQNTKIPTLWNENLVYPATPNQFMNFGVRIFKYIGVTACSGGDQWIFNGLRSDYPKIEGKRMKDFTEYFANENYIINNGFIVEAYFLLHVKDINNIISCVDDNDFRSKIWISNAMLRGYYCVNNIDKYKQGESVSIELFQAWAEKVGLVETERLILKTGAVSGAAGGAYLKGVGGGSGYSCLITDAGIITEITDENNWSSQNYTGSLLGLVECNYYIDWVTKIKYDFDGTNLVRYFINTVL